MIKRQSKNRFTDTEKNLVVTSRAHHWDRGKGRYKEKEIKRYKLLGIK